MTQYEELKKELRSIHHQYNARTLRFRTSRWLSGKGCEGRWCEKIYPSDLDMYRYFLSLEHARAWLETKLDKSAYFVQPESGIDTQYGPYIGWTAHFKKSKDFERFQAHMEEDSYLQAKRHGAPLIGVTHAILKTDDPNITAENQKEVGKSLATLAAMGIQHIFRETTRRYEVHIPDQQPAGEAQPAGEVKEKLPPPKV